MASKHSCQAIARRRLRHIDYATVYLAVRRCYSGVFRGRQRRTISVKPCTIDAFEFRPSSPCSMGMSLFNVATQSVDKAYRERAHVNAQVQLVHTDNSFRALHNDIAFSSRTQLEQLNDVTSSVRSAVIDASAVWVARSEQQHSTILRAIDASTISTSSAILQALRAVRADASRCPHAEVQAPAGTVLSASPSGYQLDSDTRLMTVVFPVLVSWSAVVVAETEFAAPGTLWHSRALWSAVFALAIYSLWMSLCTRGSSIPSAAQYSRDNGIIFIDFVGSRLALPLELCRTMSVSIPFPAY